MLSSEKSQIMGREDPGWAEVEELFVGGPKSKTGRMVGATIHTEGYLYIEMVGSPVEHNV